MTFRTCDEVPVRDPSQVYRHTGRVRLVGSGVRA
jgi:hypothetical protein